MTIKEHEAYLEAQDILTRTIHRIEDGEVLSEHTSLMLYQADMIRLAAVARYNPVAVMDVFDTLVNRSLSIPSTLSTENELHKFMEDNMRSKPDQYSDVAEDVSAILVALGDAAVDPLIDLAEEYKSDTRIELIAHTLVSIGGRRVVDWLKKAVAEYPIFGEPYFSASESSWQVEYWLSRATDGLPCVNDRLYVAGEWVSIKEVMYGYDY